MRILNKLRMSARATRGARGAWLRVDGSIEWINLGPECKRLEDLENINPDGCYMTSAGMIWFYFHIDNDLSRTHSESKELTNLAFQQLFPDSTYVGDVLAVKTLDAESDDLDITDQTWDLQQLLKPFAVKRESDGHHLFFYPH